MHPEIRNSEWCQKGISELQGLSREHSSPMHAPRIHTTNATQHRDKDSSQSTKSQSRFRALNQDQIEPGGVNRKGRRDSRDHRITHEKKGYWLLAQLPHERCSHIQPWRAAAWFYMDPALVSQARKSSRAEPWMRYGQQMRWYNTSGVLHSKLVSQRDTLFPRHPLLLWGK